MGSSPIWPPYIDSITGSGFSDVQLERLCGEPLRANGTGFRLPTWFRTSEFYGHGASFRQVTSWPGWLPIPLQSDHGIHIDNQLDPREDEGLSSVFLTWPEWRERMETGKQVIRTLNPLIAFRRMNEIRQKPDAFGTLVFIPHMKPSSGSYPAYDWDRYFKALRGLPDPLKPQAICLSRVEVRLGLHVKLRPYGLPIFSVGLPDSPSYAARFYDLVSRFEYATSSFIGSQLWYCEELGIKYFIFGESPYAPNQKTHKSWVSAQLKRYKELYSEIPPRPSPEKDRELEAALFTSQSVGELREVLLPLFRQQFFSLLPKVMIRILVLLKSADGRRRLKNVLKSQPEEN